MGDIRDKRDCDEIMSSVVRQMVREDAAAARALAAAYRAVSQVYRARPDYPCPVLDKEGKRSGRTAPVPFLQYRVNMASVLAENVKAAGEIVIASLIGPAYKAKLVHDDVLESAVGQERITGMKSMLKSVARDSADFVRKVDQIDQILFGIAINGCYEATRKSMRYCSQMIYISSAYKLAQEAHEGVYRQSGEPYIVHPLMVARTLAEKGFESEVVAAALLHDVVEDSDFTLEDINTRLTRRVGDYVSAVTAVRRQFAQAEERYRQAPPDLTAEQKQELDQATAEKLIEAAKADESMVYAVCIKAADRLHNLSTIDGMSQEKIRRKLEETERLYLPIFRAFHANYFVDAIENEMWRAASRDNGWYETVKERYEVLTSENAGSVRAMEQLLWDRAARDAERMCASAGFGRFTTSLRTEYFYPSQIYAEVAGLVIDARDLGRYVNKRNVPLARFILLLEGAKRAEDLKNFTMTYMKQLVVQAGGECMSILNAVEEKENRRIRIEIEDRYNCRAWLYIYLEDEYYQYNFGDNTAFEKDDQDQEAADEDGEDIRKMTVFSKDEKPYQIRVGSTVLDFAFKVHEEVCMFARRASINGGPFTEENLFRTLYPGDRVVVEHNADVPSEDKYAQASVRINWLNHVKTDAARKQITKWLQRRYEGKNG